MAKAWTVSRTANGINVIDENGLPVCTRVGLDDAKLIASAPLLQERVRILREALALFADFPVDGNENECAWKALDEIEREAKAALEATKEGS